MKHRPNEFVREAVGTLTAHGLTPAVSHGGKHIKIFWMAGSRRQVFITSCTPGDRRAKANSRATLRRLLRQTLEN